MIEFFEFIGRLFLAVLYIIVFLVIEEKFDLMDIICNILFWILFFGGPIIIIFMIK